MALGMALGAMAGVHTAQAQPPDVVIFLADDLSSAQAGPIARSSGAVTPTIDSIARNGINFRSGYGTPVCVQARTQLLTGLYQYRNSVAGRVGGQQGNGPQPPGSIKTIAEMLKPLGYRTGIVGKWHLGWSAAQKPNAQGFDYSYVWQGLTPHYVGADNRAKMSPYENGVQKVNTGLVTDRIADKAIAFITGTPATTPLFLYVPWLAPHDPLEGVTLAGRVEQNDAAMARVMKSLRPNTVIFYMGDNGRADGSNKPFKGGKYNIWEGGVRVPFYMQWTGHITTGQVVNTPAGFIDVAPTILKIAGGAPVKTDGKDLLNLPADRTVFFDAFDPSPGYAVRRGKWKFYLNWEGTQNRLYDVEADKAENINLAASNPDLVKELTAAINQFKVLIND